jgi:hypothetical protein
MSTVQEIKRAMRKLPLGKRLKLVKWAVKEANTAWDKQLAEDAASGNLDFLVNEAKVAAAKGRLHDFPSR